VNLVLGLAQFKGDNTATVRFAEARDQAGPDARWPREIGLVEHHHSGRLLLRGVFAGHYLDVDEGDRVSQTHAAGGAVAGGLVGVLGGPAGIAVGLVLGGIIGAHTGTPTDAEAEPEPLADRLREAMPKSYSAIVLIGPASDVDAMLSAVGGDAESQLRTELTAEQAAALEAALKDAPSVEAAG